MTSYEGRVWKFGDDVNTDLIIPGKYLDNYDPVHLASHAMEAVRKDFATGVRKGDVIVAGSNFGCGSSREQAVIALKASGVSAVVAKSFARIFYRNAINLGLPALVSSEASHVFSDGDVVLLDSVLGQLKSGDGTKRADIERPPAHIERILEAGGLVPYLKSKLCARRMNKNV
ncbi:MAG TPA: 3-isopropylmalate dehydratase small subunit [Thermoplasmata archaeon]